MPKSLISINDPTTTWKDPKAKSIGYFAKGPVVTLTSQAVAEIRAMALETGENVRLSLHESPESDFHEMIIFQHHDKYYRPKKHVGKAKSFHMIEGTMAVICFNDDGSILDSCVLDGKDRIMYRVAANIYHTDIPMTDYVIIHESTLGPFMGDEDRVFAPWAPPADDRDAYLAFRDRLLATLR